MGISIFTSPTVPDRKSYLSLSTHQHSICPRNRQHWTLAAHFEAVTARIDVYPDSVDILGENPYCNDVGPAAEPQSIWRAISGLVTVALSTGAQTEPCTGEPYHASVLLEKVILAMGE